MTMVTMKVKVKVKMNREHYHDTLSGYQTTLSHRFPGRVAPSVDNYDTMSDFQIALNKYNNAKATWEDWNNRKEQAERLTEQGWDRTAQGNP
jgi:hypothetical protein